MVVEIKENNRNIVILSVISAALTWYMNHRMGYGAIIANGLVGVMGAIFLPTTLAGAVFTSSFVGMSSAEVIPSLNWAIVGGFIVGAIISLTKEIYAGFGGKGGTTAATATLITKIIMTLFG